MSSALPTDTVGATDTDVKESDDSAKENLETIKNTIMTDNKSLTDSAKENDIQSDDECKPKVDDKSINANDHNKRKSTESDSTAGEPVKLKVDPQADIKKMLKKSGLHSDLLEKLDELSSLEREIAEMHHVEPTTPALAKRVSRDEGLHADYPSDEKVVLLEMKPPRRFSAKPAQEQPAKAADKVEKSAADIIASVEDTLEHDELIAVLKGIDQTDPATSTSPNPAPIETGVTIEGEGEFQIMEVFDCDLEQVETSAAKGSEKEASPVAHPAPLNPTVTVTRTTKKMGVPKKPAPQMSLEEARVVAMEQMAGLKTRRRKQDPKPTHTVVKEEVTESTASYGNLVTSLQADWSDDEEDKDAATAGKAKPDAKATIKKEGSDTKRKTDGPIVTNVVILPSIGALDKNKKTAATVKLEPDDSGDAKQIKEEPDNGHPQALSPGDTPPLTGFTRTRIIKRKIIWDPDAHVTQNTYARSGRPSMPVLTNSKVSPVAKGGPVPTPVVATAAAATSPAKRLPTKMEACLPAKKGRPALNREVAQPKVAETDKKLPVKAKGGKVTPTTSTVAMAKTARTSMAAAATNNNNAAFKEPTNASAASLPATVTSATATTTTTVGAKRRSVTPVAVNGSPNGAAAKKKKVSEIDRLMSDEGAVNMLNALGEKRTDTDTQRPLMRSRAAAAAASSNVTTTEKAQPGKSSTPATGVVVIKKEKVAVGPAEATSPPTATPSTSKGKRQTNKQKPSATWDYFYKQQRVEEDSMIIRRRSNSSYSSNASVRLSLDAPEEVAAAPAAAAAAAKPPAETAKATKSSAPSLSNAKNATKTLAAPAKFEFAKPVSKSTAPAAASSQKQAVATITSAAAKGGRRSLKGVVGMTAAEAAASAAPLNKKTNLSSALDIAVKKCGNVFQILFTTTKSAINYTFTMELLNKMSEVLYLLGRDDDCHVVAVMTNMPHFCQGIDFTQLTMGDIHKRAHAAAQLAMAVKRYLRTLATFPKPLVAGVNGTNIGLGVTQLALFDVVVGGEKCSFETPYAKFGQLPEGYCFWQNLSKIRSNFKTKLMWFCEKMNTTDAVLGGLLNKVAPPDKVNDEALISAQKLATFSPETYRAMKQIGLEHTLQDTLNALEEEFDTITTQWTSEECYHHFKCYLHNDRRF